MTVTEALAPPARYVTEIPIDEIHPVGHNRHLGDVEGLEGMAATMRIVGVLEPLLVRSNEGAGYELIAGARRQAAARLAGLTTVPCLIENDRSDEDVELARIIENLQRLDPTEIEEAQAYERLMKPPFNLTATAIAGSVGRSESHISKRRSLLVLPEAAQAALVDKRINIQTALGMTALVRDRARLEKVVDAIPDPDSTNELLERERQELDRRLARELEDQKRAARVAAKIDALEHDDETVVDYPPYGNWSSTEYRIVRADEAHEAVAVDPVSEKVVKVTTQPLPEANRHVPKPSRKDDPGFVEQARRERERLAALETEQRRAVATSILNGAGHDDELTRYVFEAILGFALGDDMPIDYGVAPTVRALLGFGDDDPTLAEYAARTNLTRLRTTAAVVMATPEQELMRPRLNTLKPGAWASADLGSDDADDMAHVRRYLRLLERHDYEIPAELAAAIVAGPSEDGDE